MAKARISVEIGHQIAQDHSSASMRDPAIGILFDVSAGQIPLSEGARLLGMQDVGCLLQKLRDEGLSLPRYPSWMRAAKRRPRTPLLPIA